MNKREWEAEQIMKMTTVLRNEPLCNVLMYAAAYLRQSNNNICGPNAHDRYNADVLEEFSDILATRNTEAY